MTDSESLIATEKQALDQWSAGNPLGYLDIHADDVTYFDDIAASELLNGKAATTKYMEGLAGNIPPHNYEIVNPNVQMFGDVGILTMHYKGWLDDGTNLPLWKATSVYRKTDGEWKIVHAHWSIVKTTD